MGALRPCGGLTAAAAPRCRCPVGPATLRCRCPRCRRLVGLATCVLAASRFETSPGDLLMFQMLLAWNEKHQKQQCMIYAIAGLCNVLGVVVLRAAMANMGNINMGLMLYYIIL